MERVGLPVPLTLAGFGILVVLVWALALRESGPVLLMVGTVLAILGLALAGREVMTYDEWLSRVRAL